MQCIISYIHKAAGNTSASIEKDELIEVLSILHFYSGCGMYVMGTIIDSYFDTEGTYTNEQYIKPKYAPEKYMQGLERLFSSGGTKYYFAALGHHFSMPVTESCLALFNSN